MPDSDPADTSGRQASWRRAIESRSARVWADLQRLQAARLDIEVAFRNQAFLIDSAGREQAAAVVEQALDRAAK